MTQTSTRQEQAILVGIDGEELVVREVDREAARARRISRLRLIWSCRSMLVRLAAAGLLFSIGIAFLIPRRFEATTRLMPPESSGNNRMAMLATLTGKAPPGLGGLASELLGLKNPGALFIGVLRSRTVADRLIDQFDLRSVYGDRRMEEAREDLEDRTRIVEDRKSGIIALTVIDREPKRAAAIAQTYVLELNRLVAQLTTSSAHRERMFLEERLKEIKADLDSSAKEFSEFASQNTAIDIKEQGKAMVEAAATLQGQLIANQAELSGLEQIYTSGNYRVRALRAKIAELRRQLDKLGDDTPSNGGVLSRERPLYPSIRKLPLLGVTYTDLYRRTRIQETVYELLTQQYELAKVEEAKEIPLVKILDAAIVPETKSFPPRLAIIGAGTLLTLGGGIIWIVGKASWGEVPTDDPAKSLVEEIRQSIRVRGVGISPNGSRPETE